MIIEAYPGVPPWEWEARPEWFQRVMTTLNARADAHRVLHPELYDDD